MPIFTSVARCKHGHRRSNIAARLTVFVFCSLMVLTGLSLLDPSHTLAQTGDQEWSTPIILFEGNEQGKIFTPVVVADQSGSLHVFWRFVTEDKVELIYYTRWDGEEWSAPLDVVAAPFIMYPAATADSDGNLYLTWYGDGERLFYSQAPIQEALSARGWSNPAVVDQTNFVSAITTDSSSVVHRAYSKTDALGLFYQNSTDEGYTWSPPVNVSPTSRYDSVANFVRMAVGPDNSIHIVWTEFQSPDFWPPTGLFYSHSADGGQTWLDRIELAGEGFNQANVVVDNDNNVHAVWNGMAGIQGRYHRWSADGGETWSEVKKLDTAEREGSTGPPPLVVDSAGMVHLIMTDADEFEADCVFYTFWRNQNWARPTCISGAKARESDFIEEPTMAISEGNKLHVVFWDNRTRLWYTTKQTQAPTIDPIPLPTLMPTATATPHATPTPKPTLSLEATRVLTSEFQANKTTQISNPGRPILLAVFPTAAFIGVIVLAYSLFRRKY